MADRTNSLTSWWTNLSLRDSLVLLIGGIAVAWYFCCIFFVGHGAIFQAGTDTTVASPALLISQSTFDFMSLSITTISGTLATFLGLVLGFGQVQSSRKVKEAARKALLEKVTQESGEAEEGESDTSRSPIDPRMLTRQASVGGIQKPEASEENSTAAPPESLGVSWIQSLAAFAYLASLVWALVMFVQDDAGELAAVLQNLAKSTLGVIGGVLAVVLNVK